VTGTEATRLMPPTSGAAPQLNYCPDRTPDDGRPAAAPRLGTDRLKRR
jgi:hypothetical protein